MTEPVYALTMEMAVGSMTDVTSYCVGMSWGRKLCDALTGLSADQAVIQFFNDVGSFSPFKNTNIVPGRRVALSATYGGSSYSLYSGRITEAYVEPGLAQQLATIETLSDVDRISRTTLTTSFYQNINVGSLFVELLSRTNVASFSVDALTDTVPFVWYNARPAVEAFNSLIRSGYYQAYVDGAGTVKVRGRYWTFAGSLVAQNSMDEWYSMRGRLDAAAVVNNLKISAQARQLQAGVSTLAWIGSAIAIPASGWAGFFLAYADPTEPGAEIPVASTVTPVMSQDWYLSTSVDSGGTDVTSTASFSLTTFATTAVATVFNGTGQSAYINRFQIRGYPFVRVPELSVTKQDSASISTYGSRQQELKLEFGQSYGYLNNIGLYILGERAQARKQTEYSLKNQWPEQLVRQVGDTVNLNHIPTGIGSMWQIYSIQHEIALAYGLEHITTFKAYTAGASPWFILDHPTFGKLDSGRQLAL